MFITVLKRDLLEKLRVALLVKKFSAFMEPEYLLPFAQKHISNSYSEPHESNPQPLHNFETDVIITVQSTSRSYERFLPFKLSDQNFVSNSYLPCAYLTPFFQKYPPKSGHHVTFRKALFSTSCKPPPSQAEHTCRRATVRDY